MSTCASVTRRHNAGMSLRNIAGQRFGRAVALRKVGKNKWGYVLWEMRCDCNNTFVSVSRDISSGDTKSCGCYKSDITSARNFRHGHCGGEFNREYRIWTGLKTRCYNPKHYSYRHYGGRGIKVCDSWRNDFDQFLRDMGPAPSIKHSIGRINNDISYSKDNCEWQTQSQQARNTRRSHWLEAHGKRMVLKDWSEEIGVSPAAIRKRLSRGKTPEEALV